jgi:signal transduction histidine kinase
VTLIRQDGRLDLAVHDDGRGFAAGTVEQRGLAGLRDRITALGGTLELSSHPDTGTRISTSLPVS